MAIPGRIGNARLVLKPAAGTSAGPRFTLDQIPQEVRDEVEEALVELAKVPGARIEQEFRTIEDMKRYLGWVASYCEQREPALYFRKSPVKGLAENQCAFRIETFEAKEARDKAKAEAEAKREAKKVEDAKAVNGSVPAKKVAAAAKK